jgi:uncharacterized membrane protein
MRLLASQHSVVSGAGERPALFSSTNKGCLMKNSTLIVYSAIVSLLTLGVSAGTALAADKEGMEKCAGIAKAGKNDCGTSTHACAGQSKAEGKEEWVYVPKGTCDRIAGGSVVAKKK